MHKVNWRGIVFLLFILTLASGLSYLALHNNLTSKASKAGKEMSIAVVNEDEGAMFNDSKVMFGDEFVKSIDKGNDHDWYVVSRGVAENGYERNAYNMMIIIPSDFSEKAVSIHADAPEQVVLNYKINNSSGHEDIKAEAEKTTSLLLNDFNRQIIDVYFASVIGNLQDAQENITAIIDQEETYTNRYNANIHNPLSNYTSQFKAVKNNTEISKDSFGNLEDILHTFKDNLHDDVEDSYDYSTNMEDLLNKKETHGSLTEDFYDQLQSFNQRLTDQDVLNQLEKLKATNKAINRQFKEVNEDRDKTIATQVKKIQAQVNKSKEQVDELQKQLEEELPNDLKEKVEDNLTKALKGKLDGFEGYFKDVDETVHLQIKEQIRELPSLSLEEIGPEYFSDAQAKELRNAVKLTNKYTSEASLDGDKDKLLPSEMEDIKEIKRQLINGVTLEDEVKIPATKTEQTFEVTTNVPDEYKLEGINVTLPNKEPKFVKSGTKIPFSPSEKGILKVSINVKLKEEFKDDVNFLEPINWDWELSQKNTEGKSENTNEEVSSIFVPINVEIASETTKKEENKDNSTKAINKTKENTSNKEPSSEQDTSQSETNKPNKDNKDKEDSNNQDGPTNNETPTDNKDQDGGDSNDNSSDNNEDDATEGDDENSDEDGNGDKEPGYNEIKITNNTISHHITSWPKSAIDDSKVDLEALIESAANTVSEYQKLNSLYELYYGFDMSDDLSEKVKNANDREDLADLATKDSLHYSINDKDALERIIDYINNDVANEVTKEIEKPLKGIIEDIEQHKEVILTVDNQSEELAEKIANTKLEAKELNDALSETLSNASDWRENSLSLTENHTEIVQKDSDEHKAIMTLDGEFQSLLTSSQSLAGLAEGNLDTADNVYQTFDSIDEQANQIEQSGAELVNEAEELSAQMTEKLLNDKEYAENFQDVLANSRVGDRQNENLYEFLSNPVDAKNQDTIRAGDTFTPYFLVLICFIVALFTAYALSTGQQKQLTAGRFDEEHTLMQMNLPITGTTVGLGIVEGLIIGIASGYLLDISQTRLFTWVSILMLVMLTMLVVATYLLRQLKMFGMFILLTILSLYLFFTKALGFGVNQSSLVENVRAFSPLQYIETLFNSVAKGAGEGNPILWIVLTLTLLTIIGIVANLFVVYKSRTTEPKGEEYEEAN